MDKIVKFFKKIKPKELRLISKLKLLSLKKKIAVIIVFVILILIVGRVISQATKDPGYTLAKAQIESIDEIVSETGNIVTNSKTDIYSPSKGTVSEVFVDNGMYVEKGQVLFEVKSSATEQERRAAEANYLAAVSALNSAKSTRDLLQAEMFSSWQIFQNTATSDKYENSDGTPKHEERATAEFHIAEKNWLATEKKYNDQVTVIAQAQANVSSAILLYEATKDAVVKSTAEGVVENISVRVGGGVDINQVLSPVTPVMTIVGNAPTEVSVKLGESDIVKVRPGQSVEIKVTAIRDKVFQGNVRRVDAVGVDDMGVTRYTAYIQVINPDENIRLGMSVDAEIKTKSIKNVLTVPNSAVKPYEGGRAVRVVNERTKEIEFVPVEIGIRGKTKTQIVSGIDEGQKVITALSNENIKRPSLF